MKPDVSRRVFLKVSLVTVLGSRGVRGFAAAGKMAPSPDGLTAYQEGPQIWIRWNNEVVTSYRAHPSQKYPYFYPLAGPMTGLSLTTETSLPWPHHRSLLFGCDRVNGANYWQGPISAGQIVSLGPQLGTTTKDSVEILDSCRWAVPGQQPVLSDERRFIWRMVSPELRFLDAEIVWKAEQDVTVEKTNHSLFAIRVAPDIAPLNGGHLANAEGAQGEKETFGQVSGWCAFWGARRGHGPVEGVALFDHPSNPWAPTPWFTRDYGFMSPTPFQFQKQPWHLPKGESVRLRYRVVMFAGSPQDVKLPTLYDAWSKE